MNLDDYIRDVPDFPKPGILFKDISPLLANPDALGYTIGKMVGELVDYEPDKIAGIESRGFIFGAAVAKEIGRGFIPIRKPGKLPWKTKRVEYELEYGTDAIEMHEDAIVPGERVALIDDLLATGGTLEASIRLVEAMGGVVAASIVVVELGFLEGRKKLGDCPLVALLRY